MTDMEKGSLPGDVPPNLRFLRVLVTVLTATMIAGLVIVIALLVIRLSPEKTSVPLPDPIRLPAGKTAVAFTRGTGWYAVVTEDQHILIFDSMTGTLRQTVSIESGD